MTMILSGTDNGDFRSNRHPSIADDLRLRPSDRTILAHLRSGKEITPMKALVVYGLSRLAAHVHRIRQAGYDVKTTHSKDESGHKYASYRLASH